MQYIGIRFCIVGEKIGKGFSQDLLPGIPCHSLRRPVEKGDMPSPVYCHDTGIEIVENHFKPSIFKPDSLKKILENTLILKNLQAPGKALAVIPEERINNPCEAAGFSGGICNIKINPLWYRLPGGCRIQCAGIGTRSRDSRQ